MKDKSDRFDEEMVDHRQEGRACQIRGHRKLFITCEDCHQVINQATFKAPNDWISIHDQLPKEGQLVLIYLRDQISLRVFENNAFHDIDSDYYTPLLMENGVTHWQPVFAPEPSK